MVHKEQEVRKNRIGKSSIVPERPLVPFIEVERTGLISYKLRLTPHPDYPYTTWTGSRRSRPSVYDYYLAPRVLEEYWYAKGSEAHARAKAKRILNNYLRRVSYRTGAKVRIQGKVI
jgi:hypothetical protein